MIPDEVRGRFDEIEPLAQRIYARLRGEVEKLGFGEEVVTLDSPDAAFYRLEKDPANGTFALVGDWRDDKGMKKGMLLFHGDGSFYVEQDIARVHPGTKRWFVEAVTAWGRGDEIKAESRLLPMPE